MTTLEPRGRMTKPLVPQHNVGDAVTALVTERRRYGRVRAGEAGTVRRIVISAPGDGDDTFLMFYVKVARGTVFLHGSEIGPAAEAGAYSWARRQLEGLA